MKIFNIHFLILLIIAFSVCISDIFIYFFHLNFIFINLISILLVSLLVLILKKKNYINIQSDFSKYDLLFIFGFLIYIIISIVFPDLSWDTRSYHIYLQENVFTDKINMDFFAGRNLNSFLFALGDRINYLFRFLLGYRLGTIITYYLILVLYYQVKRWISNMSGCKNPLFLSLFSILPCGMSVIFSFSGTYYIDNFGAVFLLEAFYILFCEQDLLKDKIKLYVLAIIIGIAISIKITNVIFLIPIGLYYLIKNRKEFKFLKPYDYIFGIFLVILPWIIYALSNYQQTGNPVFPYYNQIFQSEYFAKTEWKDTNFGPKNIVQLIIWPLYIVVNPLSAFDTKFVDIMWGLGFIICILNLFFYKIHKKNKNIRIFHLSIILLIMYYLWGSMLVGYVRYASVLLVLSLIVCISFIYLQYDKKRIMSIALTVLIILASIPSFGYDFLIIIKDYHSFNEWISEYNSNLKFIFKDRNIKKIDFDGILGAIGDDSLIPCLLRNNNPIYNLEEWITITNPKTENLYHQKIFDKEIYVLVDKQTFERKKDYLNRNQFEILEQEELTDNFNLFSPSDTLYKLKVMKKTNN